ncbi:MAG: CapA family protein [Prevotella sp.]|nr:CapA family protein [Prevotella sp.]
MLTVTALSCNLTGEGRQQGEPEDSTTVNAEPQQLSLLIAGDLMQHEPQIKKALQPDGTYNYDECFARVRPEIERADIAIANFEVTLGGRPYKGYPQFSAPDEYLQACIDAGFDVLTTSNNHCLDTRRRGLERTLDMMDSLRVPHLGTYRNQAERDKNYPFLIEWNDIRVVLLNFTYGTNGLRVEKPNVVNMMDTTEIARDLLKAKQMNPDVIIAMPHWGIEYQTLPSKEQKEVAQWLLDHGVDHVIGGHPHVAQPLELRNGGRNLVAWSLGNFISNQYKPNTYGGYMVRMEFTKRDSVTTLSDCGYALYWVSRPQDCGHKHQYRVLPIDEPDSVLTAAERQKRNTVRTAMRNLMQKNNQGGIKEYTFE